MCRDGLLHVSGQGSRADETDQGFELAQSQVHSPWTHIDASSSLSLPHELMNSRNTTFIKRFLASKYGTPVAVLLLVITLNSTLLLLSQILQQSTSRLYHHGEGRSFMSVNVDARPDGDHHDSKTSASSILDAVSSTKTVTDNIAGRNMEEAMAFQPVDIVYTWVNGSDPRHAKGSFQHFQF